MLRKILEEDGRVAMLRKFKQMLEEERRDSMLINGRKFF
jgi:hypothetical protein